MGSIYNNTPNILNSLISSTGVVPNTNAPTGGKISPQMQAFGQGGGKAGKGGGGLRGSGYQGGVGMGEPLQAGQPQGWNFRNWFRMPYQPTGGPMGDVTNYIPRMVG